MPSWQGKSKGTKTGYRIFVFVLRKFGLFPAYFLLRFVAFYYVLFSYRSTSAMYAYFTTIHGYGRFQSILRIYRNYFWFGQSLIDKMVLMAGIPNRFTFDFDGEQYLFEIESKKKGGLLISAHIGNWEIAGFLMNRLETRTNIVMFDGEHRKIKDYLDQVLSQRPVNIIVVKDDLSHIYKISEALQNNEFVCMHADRFVEGNRTVKRKFLGKPADFPVGPFLLAARLKVPVAFVFALKESKLHYHFFTCRPKTYDHLEKKVQHEVMMSDFISELEAKVRKYPDQWFNYYNFWKA